MVRRCLRLAFFGVVKGQGERVEGFVERLKRCKKGDNFRFSAGHSEPRMA